MPAPLRLSRSSRWLLLRSSPRRRPSVISASCYMTPSPATIAVVLGLLVLYRFGLAFHGASHHRLYKRAPTRTPTDSWPGAAIAFVRQRRIGFAVSGADATIGPGTRPGGTCGPSATVLGRARVSLGEVACVIVLVAALLHHPGLDKGLLLERARLVRRHLVQPLSLALHADVGLWLAPTPARGGARDRSCVCVDAMGQGPRSGDVVAARSRGLLHDQPRSSRMAEPAQTASASDYEVREDLLRWA